MSLSLSSLGQAAVCPGSAVLPGAEGVAGNPGSALHEYVSVLLRRGREAADSEIDAIVGRWALADGDASIVRWRAGYFEPDVPEGALSEVALCLMDNGSVVGVEGGRGRYDMPPGGIIAGTLDVLWSEPEPLDQDDKGRWRAPRRGQLWAIDLKTGSEAHVPEVERNWQVKGSALLAARWLGLPTRGVVGALCFLPRAKTDARGGRWSAIPQAWTDQDLADIELEIRRVVARVRQAEAALDAGELPELVAGPHCTFCKARVSCPAYAVEARALIRPTVDRKLPLPKLDEMTPEMLSRAAAALPDIERASRDLRDLLVAAVEARGPIELGDGRVWGPEDCGTVERPTVRALYQAAVSEFAGILQGGLDLPEGELDADCLRRAGELADEAFKPVLAKLEQAVRVAMAEVGEKRTLGRHMGRIKGKALEAGGARQERVVKWRPHHPKNTALLSAAFERSKETEATE